MFVRTYVCTDFGEGVEGSPKATSDVWRRKVGNFNWKGETCFILAVHALGKGECSHKGRQLYSSLTLNFRIYTYTT